MNVTVRTEKKMLTSRTFSFRFSHEVTMIVTGIWCSCSEANHRQTDGQKWHALHNLTHSLPNHFHMLHYNLPPSKHVTQVQLFLHGNITKHSLIFTMLAYSLVSLYRLYRVWEYQMNIIKIFKNQMIKTHM